MSIFHVVRSAFRLWSATRSTNLAITIIFQRPSRDDSTCEQAHNMIRPYNASHDADQVLDIWLQASIQSHAFVAESFWRAQLDDMRNMYLPQSETIVLEEIGQIEGFFSLDGKRLAALFIAPTSQGKGCGKQLLNEAKNRRDTLELTVYSANTRACEFYQACGFVFVTEQKDTHTGQLERVMRWQRST